MATKTDSSIEVIEEDERYISEYLDQIHGIYETCITKLAKHIPDESECHKIFHTIYQRWGISLLADRFDEFNEIFKQMLTPFTTDHIGLTTQIIDEFDEVQYREEAGDLTVEQAREYVGDYTTDHIELPTQMFDEKPDRFKLFEEARRAPREQLIAEVQCREEAGDITTEQAKVMLASLEHIAEWEIVQDATMMEKDDDVGDEF